MSSERGGVKIRFCIICIDFNWQNEAINTLCLTLYCGHFSRPSGFHCPYLRVGNSKTFNLVNWKQLPRGTRFTQPRSHIDFLKWFILWCWKQLRYRSAEVRMNLLDVSCVVWWITCFDSNVHLAFANRDMVNICCWWFLKKGNRVHIRASMIPDYHLHI